MTMQDLELTVHKMVAESLQEPKESGKQRVLTEWRSKLAKEPHGLQSFQIDEIVRKVRTRLTSASLQPASAVS